MKGADDAAPNNNNKIDSQQTKNSMLFRELYSIYLNLRIHKNKMHQNNE